MVVSLLICSNIAIQQLHNCVACIHVMSFWLAVQKSAVRKDFNGNQHMAINVSAGRVIVNSQQPGHSVQRTDIL